MGLSVGATTVSGKRTCTITGTIDSSVAAGTIQVTITATNAQGSVQIPVSIVVAPATVVPTLTATASGAALAEGGTATISFAISANPSAALTLSLAADSAGVAVAADYTLSATEVVVGVDGSLVPSSVTVTAVDDSIDEDDETLVLAYTVSPSSPGVAAPAATTLRITDNDTRGISGSGGASLAVDEGGVSSYTLVLDSEPTADVMVALASSDAGKLTVAPATITFTAQNWSDAQTVEVTALADVDSDDEAVSVSYTVTGGDYDAFSLAAQAVAVRDTTSTTVPILTATASGAVIAEGGTATIIFGISANPSAALTLSLAADSAGVAVAADYTLSATEVVVGVDGSLVPSSVTVTAVDDSIDEDDETLVLAYTLSPSSPGVAAPAATTLRITDNDTRGISGSGGASLAVDEGGVSGYTLVLDSEPTADVMVALASSDAAKLTVAPATITFTAQNWSDAQTVEVTALADVDSDDEAVSVSYTVTGGDYDAFSLAAQAVAVRDTTSTTVPILTATASGAVIAEGGMATVSFAISANPAAALTLSLAADSAGTAAAADYTLSATEVAIGVDGSVVPATVTIMAVDDDVDESTEDVVIGYTLAPGSAGVATPAATRLSITDDDTRGITSSAGGALSVDEGRTVEFTLVLDSQPTGNVSVELTSSDSGKVRVDAPQLTFRPEDWDSPQRIIATSLGDADTDDETVTISFEVSGGDYDGYSLAPQVVMVNDAGAPAPVITVAAMVASIDEGSKSDLTFSIDANPSVPLSITLSADPSGTAALGSDYTLSATTVAIGVGGRIDPEKVEVVVSDDRIAEGDREIVIAYAVAPGSAGVAAPAATRLALVDNDTVGITSTGGASLMVDELGMVPYTLVLDSEPTANVTVALASSDVTKIAAAPASLSFTDANWDTPQTVTVSALEDADMNDEMVSISYTVAGGDYDGFALPAQMVAVRDTVPMVAPVLTATASAISLAEGGTASISLAISANPSAALTVALSADSTSVAGLGADFMLSATEVSIAVDGSISPAMVTVTAVDDDIDEGDEAIVIGYAVTPGSAGVGAPSPTRLTLTDDDTRGITSTGGASLAVDEGATAEYTLALDSEPTATVMVALASSDEGVIRVAPATLSFTALDWDTAQVVTVSGVADDDRGDEVASVSYTVVGGDYDGFSLADQVVAVSDTTPAPPPVVTVATAARSVAEGGEAVLTFSISEDPSEAISLDLAFGGTADLTEDFTSSVDQVQIDTAGVITPMDVRLSFIDDDVDELNETVMVQYTINAGATGIVAPTQTGLTIIDNDTRGITSTGGASLAVDEGSTATYTLALDSEPTAGVMVALASSDADKATVSPATLTFTDTDWDTAQTVTVTGVADADTDDETVSISYTVTGGDYDAFSLAAQAVAVADTTVVAGPELTVTASAASVEEGGTVTLGFAISANPAAALTVALSAGSSSVAGLGGDFTLSATEVTIGTDGAIAPTMVTLSAVDDDIDEGDEAIVVAYAVTPGSAGVAAPADTSLTLTDNDTRGITSTGGASLAVDEGSTATYTLALDSEPTAGVMVALASSDADKATVSPATLTFTDTDWDTAQTVTVTGVADADTDDETVSISYTVTGGDYDAFSLAAQAVAVADTTVAAGPELTVTASAASVEEGGTVTLGFAISANPAAALTVALSAGSSSVAGLGGDFTLSATEVTIGTDGAIAPTMVMLSAVDDDIDEGDEAIVVAYAVTPGSAGVAAPADTSLTLTDNDTRGITSTGGASLAVDEGSTATYTLALDSEPTAGVMVALASSDADKATVSPATLTFTDTDWDTAQTVTVTGVADADTGDETVSISYTVTGGDYDAFSLAAQAVAVADTTPGPPTTMPSLSVSASGTSVSEGNSLSLTFTLAGGMPEEEVRVAITAAQATGSMGMVNSRDYFLSANELVISTAGALTPSAPIRVTAPHDSLVELEKQIDISFNVTSGAAAVDATLDDIGLTLVDVDRASVSIRDSVVSVAEEMTASLVMVELADASGDTDLMLAADFDLVFNARLEGASGSAEAGSDFVDLDANAQVIIDRGTRLEQLTIRLVNDAVVEDDESFILLLDPQGFPSNVVLSPTGTQLSVLFTITDGDTTSFDVDEVQVTEGTDSEASIALTLGQALPYAVTAEFRLTDGTAMAGEDYTDFTNTPMMVAIPANMGTASISVAILDDEVAELAESFSVEFVGATRSGAATPVLGDSAVVATVEILDDDRFVSFDVASSVAAEGSSREVFVNLNPAPTQDAMVSLRRTGTAAAADYALTGLTGTDPNYMLAAPMGLARISFTVAAASDNLSDDDETLAFALTGPSGYQTAAPSTHTLTIDDVAANTVSFSGASGSVVEGGREHRVTVVVNPAPTSDLDLTLTRSGDAPGTHYGVEGLTGTDPGYTLTVPANQTSASFSLEGNYDATVDGDITSTFTLTAPASYSLGSTSAYEFTVSDGTTRRVGFTTDQQIYFEAEGDDEDGPTVTLSLDRAIHSEDLVVEVGCEIVGGLAPTFQGLTLTNPCAADVEVTIPAGETSQSFDVGYTDDSASNAHSLILFSINDTRSSAKYDAGDTDEQTFVVRDDELQLTSLMLTGVDPNAGSGTPGGPVERHFFSFIRRGTSLVFSSDRTSEVPAFPLNFGVNLSHPTLSAVIRWVYPVDLDLDSDLFSNDFVNQEHRLIPVRVVSEATDPSSQTHTIQLLSDAGNPPTRDPIILEEYTIVFGFAESSDN